MIHGMRIWVALAGAACGLAFAGSLDAAPAPATPPTIVTAMAFRPVTFGQELWAAPILAQYQQARPGTWHRGSWSGQTWIVVEVVDTKGQVSYEAIQDSTLHNRITRAQDDYVTAVQSWKKAKSLAAANKTKFDDKKPVPGSVSRVQTTPATYRSQNLANVVVLKLTKQLEARKKAKETR